MTVITAFRQLLGNYTPVVDINGNIYPDYEMIALYVVFIIAFYFTLKFIFSLFK